MKKRMAIFAFGLTSVLTLFLANLAYGTAILIQQDGLLKTLGFILMAVDAVVVVLLTLWAVRAFFGALWSQWQSKLVSYLRSTEMGELTTDLEDLLFQLIYYRGETKYRFRQTWRMTRLFRSLLIELNRESSAPLIPVEGSANVVVRRFPASSALTSRFLSEVRTLNGSAPEADAF